MDNEYMPIGIVVNGEDPLALLDKVRSLGMVTCDLCILPIAIPPEKYWSKDYIELVKRTAREKGIRVTSLVCRFIGESYLDIATIKHTVGLLNRATREKAIRRIFSYSDLADKLGVKNLQAHIGFIPEDRSDPKYEELIEAVQRIADFCKENDQSFALETGQETAGTLVKFVKDANRPNIGVNFDPANMLLYGMRDPMEALDMLGKYVIGVHCKDGKRPERKGELGEEYPLGKGDVDIKRLVDKLKKIGYTGPLTIERSLPGLTESQWITDVLEAKHLLKRLR